KFKSSAVNIQDSTRNATYLSHNIQNELIHIMSSQIREDIAFMLTNCNYALMADECRDISGRQQLSIVIRFVRDVNDPKIDASNVVKEYFLGFVALDEFDAETLANKIVDFLKSLNISLHACICLCFDGASVMSGCHAGVHVLLKKYMPESIYIHCSAHRLNLVINDTCKVVCYISDYFSIVSNIYSFFTESGVTNMYFKVAQQELDLVKSSTLKLWGLTRCDSRWGAIDSIINNFPAIIKALVDISEEGGGSRSVNAGGLLTHVKKSIFIITSFILHQLFGIIKILSDQLENYVCGEYLIKSIIQQIKDLCNEQSFEQVYDKAKEFCSKNEIELVHQYRSHRTTKVPARFEEFIVDSTIVYPKSEYFLNIDYIDEFCAHISADSNALKNELIVIKPMVQSKQINDVVQFLNELVPFADAFPQTMKMITNSITMPISQVTCERSFSKMKIIKNYLRNSMSDKRLSDLTVLAIERDFDINYE
ncbi:unnamed protein product, partial [Didymodactylos carnosus]